MKHLTTVAAILLAGFIIIAHAFLPEIVAIPLYGLLIIGYVTGKMIFAEVWRVRFRKLERWPTAERAIDVVIAFYNEDRALLANAIEGVLASEGVTIGRVIAVDDGSKDRSTGDFITMQFAADERVHVLRMPKNVGKRHALAAAFDKLVSPYTALLDSDTIVEKDALGKLLAVMDADINAVTANIRALNHNDNLLTRLIDARYRNAFMVERAAQSVPGSVLCATGVLTAYRTKFLHRVSKEWSSQTFLNAPVQFGDDRRLTALALRDGGRAIIALDAVAATLVPTDWWVFLKQQLRWNKSFLRESFLAIKDFGVMQWPGLLSFVELFFWFFYLSTIANILFFNPEVGLWTLVATWFAYVLAAGLFRNLTLIVREPRLLLLAPLYSLIHVLLLTPLRVIALLTILDNRWGTR